jgi:hypothetical protein
VASDVEVQPAVGEARGVGDADAAERDAAVVRARGVRAALGLEQRAKRLQAVEKPAGAAR